MRPRVKKSRLLIIAISFVLLLFSILALSYPSGRFLSVNDARKKWGDTEFNTQKFKDGDSNVRASMAASLVSSKVLVGASLVSVIEKLGPSTGYYFSDMIPAYAIGDLRHGRTETWQIIFIPDRESKVVNEIKIHKKCCS
jgi:hypothetical protein